MPRPPRSSGRFHRRPSRADDDERKANPAALVAVIAIVVGGGLLLWVISGGPTRRAAPVPAPSDTANPSAGSGQAQAVSNRSPRVELRIRIDPRQPHRMEYGAFSDDPDAHDEGKLVHVWDFGDETPAVTSEHGVHVFRRAGTFTVTVKVSDAAGASVQQQQTVTIPEAQHAVQTRARQQNEVPGLRALRMDLPGRVTFSALNERWAAAEAVRATHITSAVRHRTDWYALRFTGGIIIPRAGIWSFSLTSDDGSRLILDGQKLINLDQHQSATTAYVAVQADAGVLPFQLDYYQGDGDQTLRLQWAGPGQDWQDIPSEAFVHAPQ